MSMSTPQTNVEEAYKQALSIFQLGRDMIHGCPETSATVIAARPLLYAARTVDEFRAAAKHFAKSRPSSPGVRAGIVLLKQAEKICYKAENPKKRAMAAIDVPDAPADAGSSQGGSAPSHDTEDDEDVDVATPAEPVLAKPAPLGGAAASAPADCRVSMSDAMRNDSDTFCRAAASAPADCRVSMSDAMRNDSDTFCINQAKPEPVGGAAASAPDLTRAKVSAIALDSVESCVVKMHMAAPAPELKPAPEIKPEPQRQAWPAALSGAAAADVDAKYSDIFVAPPPSPPKDTVDLTMDSEDDEPVERPRKKARDSDDDDKAPASDDDKPNKLHDEQRRPARKKARAFGGSMTEREASDDDDLTMDSEDDDDEKNVKVVYAEMMGAWEPEITEKMKELESRKLYSYKKMSENVKLALRTMPKSLALKSLDNVLTEEKIFDVNEYLILFTEGLRKMHKIDGVDEILHRSDDEDEESDDEGKSFSDEKVTYAYHLEDDCYDNLVIDIMQELHRMKKCSFSALTCHAALELQTLPNFVAETLLAQLRDDTRVIADVSTYIVKNAQQLRRDWHVGDAKSTWKEMQNEVRADDAPDSQEIEESQEDAGRRDPDSQEIPESQEDGGRQDPDENGHSLEY